MKLFIILELLEIIIFIFQAKSESGNGWVGGSGAASTGAQSDIDAEMRRSEPETEYRRSDVDTDYR